MYVVLYVNKTNPILKPIYQCWWSSLHKLNMRHSLHAVRDPLANHSADRLWLWGFAKPNDNHFKWSTTEFHWVFSFCDVQRSLSDSVTHRCLYHVCFSWLKTSRCRLFASSSTQCMWLTGKLKNLSGISWFAWVFWLVLCCVVWRQVTIPLKKCSTLMGCLGKKQLGSFSPWIDPWLVTPYETFTYLFNWNIFIRLHSANKNYPVDLLKLAITGKFGLICDSRTQTINSSETLRRSRSEDSKTLWGFLIA